MHDLPDFAYFDHSIHVNKGVACTTCHGQVDQMPLMDREATLHMEWCLECHREPERFVGPRELVFASAANPADVPQDSATELDRRVPRPQQNRLFGVSSLKWIRSLRNSTRPSKTGPQRSMRQAVLAKPRRAGRMTTQFLVPLRREFPEYANRLHDGATRRQFLQLMGASLALAGVQGCVEQPQEQIVPFVEAPEQIIPGKPLYYATAMTHDGAAVGLLVESHMGRPVKIEGNPLHPAVPEIMANAPAAGRVRFGATDAFAQAVVLSLYDPDRSQTVAHDGQIATWESFFTELQHHLQPLRERGGQGLRVLTGTVVSPTLGHQLTMLLEQFPQRAVASVRADESRQRACRQSSGVRRGCRDARLIWSRRM